MVLVRGRRRIRRLGRCLIRFRRGVRVPGVPVLLLTRRAARGGARGGRRRLALVVRPGAFRLLGRGFLRFGIRPRDAAQHLGEQAIGLAAAALGQPPVLVGVLGLAGVAAHLRDVVADHADDAVVHEPAALGAIVVNYVAEADASFHRASEGGVWRRSW
jgi:hypothetical protein